MFEIKVFTTDDKKGKGNSITIEFHVPVIPIGDSLSTYSHVDCDYTVYTDYCSDYDEVEFLKDSFMSSMAWYIDKINELMP